MTNRLSTKTSNADILNMFAAICGTICIIVNHSNDAYNDSVSTYLSGSAW